MKKVVIGTKPTTTNAGRAGDAWVKDRRDDEPMKRLTIDVSMPLHARIKSQCAIRGVKMADEVRDLLERHFSGDVAPRGESQAVNRN